LEDVLLLDAVVRTESVGHEEVAHVTPDDRRGDRHLLEERTHALGARPELRFAVLKRGLRGLCLRRALLGRRRTLGDLRFQRAREFPEGLLRFPLGGDVTRHGVHLLALRTGPAGPVEPAVRAVLGDVPVLEGDDF
jgi:hypothetical protein